MKLIDIYTPLRYDVIPSGDNLDNMTVDGVIRINIMGGVIDLVDPDFSDSSSVPPSLIMVINKTTEDETEMTEDERVENNKILLNYEIVRVTTATTSSSAANATDTDQTPPGGLTIIGVDDYSLDASAIQPDYAS